MKKSILYVLFCIISLSFDMFSLPRFSLRTGSRCIDCHVNPTGGNQRNKSGWSFGKGSLAMISPKDVDEQKEVSPYIGKNISLGFDFRTQYIVFFDSTTTRSDFHKMTGSVYTTIEASDELDVTARYDFIQQIWEAYGVLRILPNNGYIKAGTFTPNYGLKIDDHTAYTRGGDYAIITSSVAGLIYEPRYTETGIETGMNFGDMVFFTASVGGAGYPSFSKDPTYTANLRFIPEISDKFNLLVGGSFASAKAGFAPNVRNITLTGGYLGFGYGALAILAEYDIAKSLMIKEKSANAIMAEVSYKISKGIDAVLRYDYFDPNPDAEKDQRSHLTIGAEIFPYSFIELRPQYRINTEEPKYDNNAFILQFHLWY